jgi:P27 family predicted phage terminase small subunit
MRGRPPVPTRLKVLRGNPGKRALNASEPAPAPRRSLAPPAWLEGEAAAEWRRLAPKFARLGLLTEIDGEALSQYCVVWARWREAETALRKHGMVIAGSKGGPVLSPYVAIASRALSQMRAYLDGFGMTPSARTRVKTDPGPQPNDPIAKFDDDNLSRWQG